MSFQGFALGKGAQARAKAAPAAAFDGSDDEDPMQAQGSQRGAQGAAQLQEAGDRAAAAGQWSIALQRWDAALAASAADPHVLHEAKAQVLMEAGEDFKAVQSAQRAVELRPGWADAHLTLSRAQLNIGEPELALQSMERVLQLQPGHPEAAAEIVSIQTVVLQRRASGVAAGQRARVVPSGGGGAP